MRVILLLLVLLCPGLVLAQTEDSDRGYIQGLLEDALSGPGRVVRIEGFSGALSSRATIEQITVSDPDGIWLTMDDVAMVWTRSALLRGAIDIDEISVKSLALPRLPKADSSLPQAEARGSFSLPDLPVSVNLATLDVDSVKLGQPVLGQAAEFAVEGSANLAAGSGKATLDIDRVDGGGTFDLIGSFEADRRFLSLALDLQEPKGGITAQILELPGLPSIALNVAGEGPLDDFVTEIRLETDGRERLAGEITLTGTEDESTGFAADIGGDLAPVLAPQYRDFLGSEIRLKAQGARAPDGGVRLDQLTLKAAALNLEGRADVNAEGWPLSFALDGTIIPPSGERVVLPLPGETVSLSRALLSAAYDAATSESWDLQIAARDVHLGSDRVARLSLDGNGTLSRERAEVRGAVRFAATDLLPADAALARAIGPDVTGETAFDWWRGDALFLRDVTLEGQDYGLTGKAEINRHDEGFDLLIQPDISLRAETLARFGPLAGQELDGAANLKIVGRVLPLSGLVNLSFDGETRDLETGIAQLDPLLEGLARLSMSVIRDEAGLRADPVAVQSDHARIAGKADLKTGASRAEAELALTDLSRALPGLSGPAQATIETVQTGEVWAVTSTAQLPGATDISFDGTVEGDGVSALKASGRLDAAIGRLSAFSQLAGQQLGGAATFRADGSGDVLDQSFTLAANGQTQGLSLGAPALAPFLGGALSFDANVARDAAGTFRISTLSLNGANLQASLDGQFDASSGDLAYRVTLPDIGVISPRFPGPARLTGTARLTGDRWRVDASGTGPGGTAGQVNGLIYPDGPRFDLALSGTAPLTLANADLAGQDLSGVAAYDLAVVGPPALSSLSGTVRTTDARFAIPDRGLVLSPIDGRAVLSNGRAELDVQARLNTGGRLVLRGPVSLEPPFNADLDMRLRDITVREEDFVEADLEGDINLRGGLTGGARIGGDIVLTRVEMRIPNFGPSYAALDGLRHEDLPADVRQTLEFADLLGASQTGSAPRMAPYPLNLTVTAPSRLFVRGRGLDAELGGALTLRGTSADIQPQGQFDLIRGRLDLLGRRLTLTEGSVSLRGSFDPVIRFAATTQVDDVSVTLLIEGEATAPELTVVSNPELPEDEALSLFLFGRDPTQISALQALQLAAAIRTLSGQGSLGSTDTLRQNLGVSDLDVGTDAEGNTQARVGKYISDRIYTDVTVNSGGENQIRLNFDLSPSVTVRGRVTSEGETGLGVFFERDY